MTVFTVNAQNEDSLHIRKIYDEALTSLKSYDYLRELCKGIGHRLTASPASYKAVQWGDSLLSSLGCDTVYLQEIIVPHWVRGENEMAFIKGDESIPLDISALGMSIGTNDQFFSGEVVEVKSWEELDSLGESAALLGKIVLLNRAMDPTHFNTGRGYGGCVDQRYWGASRVGKYGTIGVLVRSASLKQDHHAHTGTMKYVDSVRQIPAAALSLASCDRIAERIHKGEKVEVSFKLNCKLLPDTVHYNVIAEVKGSEFPNEIITLGGHLDSWDIGEGAHDDGAGIVHSIEALRLLLLNGNRPKHTIRVVLFMNEENGNKGGKTYAEQAAKNGENHLFALESDNGGHTPRGFKVKGNEAVLDQIKSWMPLLSPYGLDAIIRSSHAGTDIHPLATRDVTQTMIGYYPDTQRYFDYHHSAADVLENVHPRELELGAASIATITYLIDKYGLPKTLEKEESKE